MFSLPIQLFWGECDSVLIIFWSCQLPSNLNQPPSHTKVRVSFHDTVDEIDFDTGIAGDDAESTTTNGEGEWIDPKEILHSKQWKTQSEALKKKEDPSCCFHSLQGYSIQVWEFGSRMVYIHIVFIYNVYIRIYIYLIFHLYTC